MNSRILIPAGLLALCALLLFFFFGQGEGSNRRADGTTGPGKAQPANAASASAQEEDLLHPGAPATDPLPPATAEAFEAQRQVLSSAAGQSWPEKETRWINLQVVVPQETPREEKFWVLAMGESMSLQKLNKQDGPLDQLRSGTSPSGLAGVQAAVLASAGDAIRIGLPPSAEESWLAVVGDYVYSLEPRHIKLPDFDETVVLRPQLGAWISGRLLAPVNDPERELSKLEAKLRWSVGSSLQLGAAKAEPIRRAALSDAEGRFELRAVPVGNPQLLYVEPESLASGFSEEITPKAGEHLQAELRMMLGGSITGRIVDTDARPVAEAEVQALGRMFAGNPTARLRETKSDAEGNFELAGVAAGLVMLRVQSEGFKVLATSPFELADGEQREEGNIVLDEGLALAGTVFFPDGSPASQATVNIEPDLSDNLAGTAVDPKSFIGAENSATVDELGDFRLVGAGAGPWSVSAKLLVPEGSAHEAGLWSASVGFVSAPAKRLELLLLPPIHLLGQVLDGAGKPVPSFKIQGKRSATQWYLPPSAQRTESFEDEQGRFRLANMREGEWTFSASANGYSTSLEQKLELPGEGVLDFVLLRPSSLAGKVIDPDGKPVAGAEVSRELEGAEVFEELQGRGDWPKASTDEEGLFKLEGLAPGAGSVLARKAGFAPSEPLSFDAEEGTEISDLVLTMRIGGSISGEVYGADGKPAAGCMLILQMPTLAERRITNTSSDGSFDERGLTPGQWQVQAFPGIEGLQSATGEALDQTTLLAALKMTLVKLDNGQSKHVVLGQAPANPVQVHGRVSLGESPIGNGVISFVPANAGGMEQLKVLKLNDDGSYAVQLDEPGSYLVTIQISSTQGRQNSIEFRRSVPAGEAHTLDFAMPLGRVSGSVRGPDGKPRAGERVTLNMEGGLVFGTVFGGQYDETVSDENGAFEIAYLRPGSYALAAGGTLGGGFLGGSNGLGRTVTSVTVEEGQWVRGVIFVLEEPGSIQGTVRDAAGALVNGASIFVRDEGGRLVELFSMAQTNASGQFEYPSLAPGAYTVLARSPTHASPSGTPVRVESGETTVVTVLVNAGTTFLVTLIDNGGSDVPSRVSVLDSNGHEMNGMIGMAELLERYNGSLGSSVQRIGPVPPGSYSVRAFAEDGRSTERTVTARGEPERKVKLRLN